MHEEKENGETVTHVSTVEARSGSRSTMTRNILMISLGLVAIAFAIALASGFFQTARTGADEVNDGNVVVNEAP